MPETTSDGVILALDQLLPAKETEGQTEGPERPRAKQTKLRRQRHERVAG
jgi:hypothetical protein